MIMRKILKLAHRSRERKMMIELQSNLLDWKIDNCWILFDEESIIIEPLQKSIKNCHNRDFINPVYTVPMGEWPSGGRI